MINITESYKEELPDILEIHKLAFGQNDEALLVSNIFKDNSAKPLFSFVARDNNIIVGHLLFSKVTFENKSGLVTAYILAPLAVLPKYQKKGVGQRLVRESLSKLADNGAELVLVFGDPEYYSRFGFKSALEMEVFTPCPISPNYEKGWMFKELKLDCVKQVKGKVICCAELNKPKYWLE